MGTAMGTVTESTKEAGVELVLGNCTGVDIPPLIFFLFFWMFKCTHSQKTP